MSQRTPALAWAGLAAVLGLFLLRMAGSRPVEAFGRYHDDTLYFSSARALAEGRGYVMPSVPGTPPQSKYPVLYPWLLSWVWQWNPAFPANIRTAVWLNAVFACCFLAVAFVMLRRMKGVGPWVALLLVALCAFQPYFQILSGALLSDMLFMTLALAAIVAADGALQPDGRKALLAVAGVLAGLSVLTRGFGLAVVAGIAAAALYRRALAHGALFGLLAAPSIAASLLKWGPVTRPDPGAAAGWRQTWIYYTSYAEFWKLSVPNLKVLGSMVSSNLQEFLQGPSSYCLFPPLGGDGSYLGLLFAITLTVGILAGIVRQAREDQWRPIHFVFVFYAALTLVWNYGIMNRFLMLFLPLFFAGLWAEGKHLAALIGENARPPRPSGTRAVAAGMALVFLALAGLALRQYATWVDLLPKVSRRGLLLEEKREAYDWIRRSTDPSARFIAYEDASLYLYTGRQAMRPIAFSTEAFYTDNAQILSRELAHIMDSPRAIGARYWVACDDDFQMETGESLIEKRIAEVEKVLPQVFRSRQGRVRVYDLSCLHSSDPRCQAVMAVLFPEPERVPRT